MAIKHPKEACVWIASHVLLDDQSVLVCFLKGIRVVSPLCDPRISDLCDHKKTRGSLSHSSQHFLILDPDLFAEGPHELISHC